MGAGKRGKELWLEQRAKWLGVPVELVANEPSRFEEEGSLLAALEEKLGKPSTSESRKTFQSTSNLSLVPSGSMNLWNWHSNDSTEDSGEESESEAEMSAGEAQA